MKAWLPALLVAVAFVPAAAGDSTGCTGGSTDAGATPLPGGYYVTTGVSGAQELWYEKNGVDGLQRSQRLCTGGSFTDADMKVASSGSVCFALICAV